MKALLRIFRLPRKLVLIVGGGALLVGSSGAAAVYFARESIPGMAKPSVSGLQCTDVNLVTIRKQNKVWIRKYIKTEPTDGLTRVTTALRVAKAVYDAQKPDLVQIVVLDENGPTLRSDIRGRALGADVVYVPHPGDVGDGLVDAPVTARYYNGDASAGGLFYGERVDMQPKDIDTLMTSLKDPSDCLDPVAAEAAAGDKGKKKTADKGGGEGKVSTEHTGSTSPEPGPDAGSTPMAEAGDAKVATH